MVVRASALLALVADLATYYAFSDDLPGISLWWRVAVIGLLLMPATFALVYLALPARRSRFVLPVVIVLAGLAVLLEVGNHEVAANFVKLAAVTGAAWFFIRFFEDVSWIVVVALVIIPVDIVSVARGPTKHILEQQPRVFDYLSIAFPVPGESSSAQLGLPDCLFFALFLAAAHQFRLRVWLTWVLCTLSFGATLAITVGFDVSGLPALPLLSAGFILANADLLWARARNRLGGARHPQRDGSG